MQPGLRRRLRSLRRVLDRVRRVLATEWQGPADMPRALMLEWRLIMARWVGIIFVAPALPLLHMPTDRLFGAYAILVGAAAYNLAIRWAIPRRPSIFGGGYITTVADSLLNIAMVSVGGGFNSPFSYFLFTMVISVAMRYGYGPTLAMTLLTAGGDALETLTLHQSLDAPFAFRAGFLVITGLLASYLRRLTVKAEIALQERLVELQRLYADLAGAHQELLSLDEAKTNFLANVSHELRTPLTSIRAFSEMLLSYDDDEEVKREFLQIISSESDRLTRLVNDVLDVTKIESGEMDFRDEPFEIGDLLDECARAFAPMAEQHGLRFVQEFFPTALPTPASTPGLAAIRGDRDRIQQVLQNLLNNAMKFTAEGSITLRAAVSGDLLRISVQDTGVGIAEQDQQRVFEKFQQVGDTLTGKPKGTGLGLTICRDIVAHHGGQLTLESHLGQGSTFTIVLPLPQDESPALLAAA